MTGDGLMTGDIKVAWKQILNQYILSISITWYLVKKTLHDELLIQLLALLLNHLLIQHLVLLLDHTTIQLLDQLLAHLVAQLLGHLVVA